VKELHDEFTELVKTTDDEVKKAQSKSSALNTLSGHIVPKIDALITKTLVMDDLRKSVSEIVLALMQIKKDLEVAQYAEQVQVAFRLGQQLIAQASANKTDELIKAEEEKTRIEDLKDKIVSGEIDPEERRKPGQRPESLRNIRNAQRVLEEETKVEAEVKKERRKPSGKSKKKITD